MASNIPVIVQGNSFSLAIPLQIYVIEDGEMVLQDYTPDPTDDVSIQLKGTRRNYTYTPSMAGNIATIDLSGNELADNYAVVVSIVKANGQRLRSFRTDQFFIVESSDDLTVDDIVQGLEENVIYLNAQAFISLGEVVISDSTTTFDANSALSAKQGVILRQNIELLLSSLGEYAFPDGKPTLDWVDETFAITLDLTDFSSSNTASSISMGSAYTTTLTPTHSGNLYFEQVVITMGDEDITSTAYNPTTGIVSIAEVTGALVITAAQYTYVQENLAFMLDCTKRGGQAGHWIDLVGGKDFVLTDVTEADSGLVFNGTTSKGVASGGLNVPYDSCTIEVVGYIEQLPQTNAQRVPILGNSIEGSAAAVVKKATPYYTVFCCSTSATNVSHPSNRYNTAFFFSTNDVAISNTKDNVVIDGVLQTSPRDHGGQTVNDYLAGLGDALTVGYYKFDGTEYYLTGKIMCIRVYNTKLTSAQMIANYEIDKKRFSL